MTAGIPVMIHLSRETFVVLEHAAKAKGIRMSELIESGLDRSIQPKPVYARGQIPAPKRASGRGWRTLDDAEWAECQRLRAAGWRVAELAVRYGCSSSAIYYRMRREARR